VKTKIDTFKKDLKMWIKLNEIFGFERDPTTGAIIALDQNWNDLLAVKAHKNYIKFRDKSLTNEDLLRTLFLDSLTIERHVVISQDIVADRIETKKNIDIEREIEEKEKKKEEHLQNDFVMKLEKETTRLNNEEERDRARLFTPSTSIAIVKSPLSTFFFAFFLKRIVID